MTKYMAYRLFMRVLIGGGNVFISGNSKKSMEIIECLRYYSLDKVFFNWHNKKGANIVLNYDSKIRTEQCVLKDGTLYIFFGEGVHIYDMAYTLLSGYFLARSKTDGSYCSLMCL